MLVIELLVGGYIQKSAKSKRLPQSTKSTFLNVFIGMSLKVGGVSCGASE